MAFKQKLTAQVNSLAQQENAIASKSAADARADSAAEKAAIDALANKLGQGIKTSDLIGDGSGNGSKVSVEGGTGTAETGYKGLYDSKLGTGAQDNAPKTSEIESMLTSKLSNVTNFLVTSGCIAPLAIASNSVLEVFNKVLSESFCERTQWIRDLIEWILKAWFVWEVWLSIKQVFAVISDTNGVFSK